MAERSKIILLCLLIAGGALIVLAGLAITKQNSPNEKTKSPTPASIEQVKRVSAQEAKVALDGGLAVFVDVRDEASYEEAHIPGAVNISIGDLTSHLNQIDKSAWIITYCT